MSSMSDRDRKILLAVIPVVVIVAYWFLLLAPKREAASTAAAEQTKQEERRDAAKAQLDTAAGAKTDFRSDYTQIVRLGKAIPADVDMPSLLVQLEGAAKGTGIHFTKISTGERAPLTPVDAAEGSTTPEGTTPPADSSSGTTPAQAGGEPAQSAPGQAAEGADNAAAQSGVDATTSTTAREGALPVGGGSTATAGEAAAAAPAGLETVPLEMEFVGDFFRLADFFHDIKRFVHVVNEDVVVNGRLVTIESVSYTSDPELFPRLRALIKATVYLAPKAEGATAGASPEGPAATPATTPAATPEPSTPSPAPTAAATR